MQVRSLDWEDPLDKGMATHSSILAGEFHEQKIWVGYSPWGHKESDTTENARTQERSAASARKTVPFFFSLSQVLEKNVHIKDH